MLKELVQHLNNLATKMNDPKQIAMDKGVPLISQLAKIMAPLSEEQTLDIFKLFIDQFLFNWKSEHKYYQKEQDK